MNQREIQSKEIASGQPKDQQKTSSSGSQQPAK